MQSVIQVSGIGNYASEILGEVKATVRSKVTNFEINAESALPIYLYPR